MTVSLSDQAVRHRRTAGAYPRIGTPRCTACQKLETDPNQPRYLLAEAGVGYRLVCRE